MIHLGGDIMNERIKRIRQNYGLSQQQFADKLHVSRNYIAQLEMKDSNKEPSSRLVADICRVFNVNENWMRTGEGDMDAPTDDTFASVCAEIGATDPRLQNVIMELWKMTDDDRELLWDFLDRLANASIKKE
jgi:transcriptional regulator with XRE-family HTH domain